MNFDKQREKLLSIYIRLIAVVGLIAVPASFFLSLNGFSNQTLYVVAAGFASMGFLLRRYEVKRYQIDEREFIYRITGK